MIKTMKDSERDAILAVAGLMVAAAKTAPKGSGRDTVVAAVVTGEDKDKLREPTLFLFVFRLYLFLLLN